MLSNHENAFWAAQEPSYNDDELSLPADTPTGTMTYAMVHKRKSTLVNRHIRQLQRLCDFQAKELHDHRQAFCARYSDLTQPNQPASEVGMFQVVSGRKWIRDNYSNVFRSEPSDPPVEVEMVEATPDDKTSAFDQLVDRLDMEQKVMKLKQAQEYETYRLFQLQELQLLNLEITTRAGDTPKSTSSTSKPEATSPPPPQSPARSVTINPEANVILINSNDSTTSRVVPQSMQSAVSKVPSPKLAHEAPSAIRPHGAPRDSNTSSATFRKIPPPPPPPPLPRTIEHPQPYHKEKRPERPSWRSEGYASTRSDVRPDTGPDMPRDLRLDSRLEIHPTRMRMISSARDDEEPSQKSHSSERKGVEQSKRLSPRPSGSGRWDERSRSRRRNKSPSKPRLPPPSKYPARGVPFTNQLPSHKKSLANPDARTSHSTSAPKHDNAPPTVESSKLKSSHGNKKNAVVPYSIKVEHRGGTWVVVRRYQGGRKPMELLGEPKDFDDAMHNPKSDSRIMQVNTYWQDEYCMCFIERKTRNVLGKVSEIELAVRKWFTSGGSTSDSHQ